MRRIKSTKAFAPNFFVFIHPAECFLYRAENLLVYFPRISHTSMTFRGNVTSSNKRHFVTINARCIIPYVVCAYIINTNVYLCLIRHIIFFRECYSVRYFSVQTKYSRSLILYNIIFLNGNSIFQFSRFSVQGLLKYLRKMCFFESYGSHQPRSSIHVGVMESLDTDRISLCEGTHSFFILFLTTLSF